MQRSAQRKSASRSHFSWPIRKMARCDSFSCVPTRERWVLEICPWCESHETFIFYRICIAGIVRKRSFLNFSQEIVDWYMAIRAVQLANFRILYPTCPIMDLLPLLSTDFLKEGYLHKTGSKVGDEYKRRWFSLHRRVLLYFVEPTVRCDGIYFCDDLVTVCLVNSV